MMIDVIKKNVNQECIKEMKLRKNGCGISLNKLPQQKLIIDLDKLNCLENQTRCDFLFIAELPEKSGWIVPIELKQGEPRVSKIEQQLQAGAKVAETLVPRDANVKFCPVVASGEGVSKRQRRTLRDISIRFRDQTKAVRRIRCEGSLHTVLE